jgi:hypothetical protein
VNYLVPTKHIKGQPKRCKYNDTLMIYAEEEKHIVCINTLQKLKDP